jgi:hypothetical protein
MLIHRRRQLIASPLVVAAILLVSLALIPAAPAAAANTIVLVNTIDTSKWNPSSPDPSGITYWPARNRLVVVDGEVEEMSIFKGANLFVSTLAGSLDDIGSTLAFSKEPVGIDIEVAPNGHFFISDDSAKQIHEIDLGSDQRLTRDDVVRSFSTSAFGNNDPEGLTLGQLGGQPRLFTVDGVGQEVYITAPGNDGIYGTGDANETTTHFDVSAIIKDPEGLDQSDSGTLFIADRSGKQIVEISTSGARLNAYDLRPFNVLNPGDVTLAPGSQNSSVKNLYVAARGVDNNADPNENDGKIYEFSLSDSPPPPPPSGNLLGNPGFETASGGQPTVWSTNTIFTQSSTVQHEGSFSGKFSAASTSNAGATIKQTVLNLSANTTYAYSAWVNIPASSDAFTFRLKVKWRNSSNSTLRTDTIATFTSHTSGAWVQKTANLTSPTGATNALVQLVVSNLSSTIYVDDMSFGP